MSWAEVKHGIKMGLFDETPVYQVTRPAGTWERNVAMLARPSVWEGLLP